MKINETAARRCASVAIRSCALSLVLFAVCSGCVRSIDHQLPAKRPWLDTTLSTGRRVTLLLDAMTLDEKLGQMIQPVYGTISLEEITTLGVGGIASGGGIGPALNTASIWYEMTAAHQHAALKSRLSIPLLYGIDAVHGNSNIYGATVFPHNIGLGATRDADLVRRIGRATALETIATGIRWNFAPVVAIPYDYRWGRTFESYSRDPAVVSSLAGAYIRGLTDRTTEFGAHGTVVATAKHFLGDGATVWGTAGGAIFGVSMGAPGYFIDQGDSVVTGKVIRRDLLPPYHAAIDAGTQSVMASYSSLHGRKMHLNKDLLSGLLREELEFKGFVVSDYEGIFRSGRDHYRQAVDAVNAGIDMAMVVNTYRELLDLWRRGIERGDLQLTRIDEAVRRILTVKFDLGLFERPVPDPAFLRFVGIQPHRDLAREAVRKSLVLLKNEGETLPLSKETPLIYIAGEGADDIGLQCGGWTIAWQGAPGKITPGWTILNGIQQLVKPESRVIFARDGVFGKNRNPAPRADVGIIVLAERPYAEGDGDRHDLRLTGKEIDLLARMRRQSRKLVVILVTGRPLIITKQLPQMDAVVVAWLPGSEGQGVADVLFGDYPFTGTLPMPWPKEALTGELNAEGIPQPFSDLFPLGYGLSTGK